MPTNPTIALNPCSIAAGSIPPRSFTTMAIINIDADIAKSVFPSCSKLSPANSVIKVRAAITPTNPAIATKPCSIAAGSIPPRIFITAAINTIETAILLSIFPSLSMSLDISSFVNTAYTAINDISEITIVSIPSIACLYWSGFNDPIIFKVAAIRTIAAPIATILADMAPKLRAPEPNLEDSIERTSITAIIAVNTPINVDNIATASHSLSGSINVNTTILPTKIAMDIAIFLIAFALILNAKDFRTLENPIKVFPMPFADSSNTFPAPESTSPSP